ncbi:MAG TPA: serine hydrolase [Nocardioidaceae bacterium]|nr:serine hydrolase [Nocardioidaceae bacterium]
MARRRTPLLLAGVTGAVLLACTASATGGPATDVRLPPVSDKEPAQYSVMPITDAKIDAAVNRVDGIVQDVMQRSRVPGMAVAVVHDGEIVYAKGFGVKKLGEPGKVNRNTVFQIASLSKSVGSTVVSRAVGQKKVRWSDRVVEHLPNFRLSDPKVTKMVTIGDLYSHRSGIPGGAGDDAEGIGFTRAQIIEKLRLFPLDPFRISYNYTNFGLTTGGQAVARAAGMSWERLSERLLYKPLGMSSTSSRYADFLKEKDRATLHAKVGKHFAPKYIRDADAQAPAGGVSSTVMDMSKWMMLNLASGKWDGEQLVKRAPLLEAHTPQSLSQPPATPDSRSTHYGYGVNISPTSSGQVQWGHSGAFYVGAATAYRMLPAADVGIVALTNAAPVGAPEAVVESFADLARTGEVERDWLGYYGGLFAQLFVNHSPVAEPPPADPAPPRRASAYVGTYTNEMFGDVRVTADGSVLRVVGIGPDNLRGRIRHYDGDVFAWRPPGGNDDPLSAVTFAGNRDGKARTVTLEFLDDYGFGTFTRR